MLLYIFKGKRKEGAADMICSNGSVAGSVAGVAFAWSLFCWRDVFGDVAADILTRYARSQGWLILGREWEWGPAMDVRVPPAFLSRGGVFRCRISEIRF